MKKKRKREYQKRWRADRKRGIYCTCHYCHRSKIERKRANSLSPHQMRKESADA